MKKILCSLGAAAAMALGTMGLGIGPAQAQATVVDCSLIEPGVEGVLIITPNGQLRANCHQHIFDETGGPAEGSAITVDCVEAIGNEGPGIGVITPSGNTLINCHIHLD